MDGLIFCAFFDFYKKGIFLHFPHLLAKKTKNGEAKYGCQNQEILPSYDLSPRNSTFVFPVGSENKLQGGSIVCYDMVLRNEMDFRVKFVAGYDFCQKLSS